MSSTTSVLLRKLPWEVGGPQGQKRPWQATPPTIFPPQAHLTHHIQLRLEGSRVGLLSVSGQGSHFIPPDSW